MLLRNSLVLLMLTLSKPVLAQSTKPLECLQQAVAVEQSSAWLRALTALPTPPLVPVVTAFEPKYVMTSSLFADVIGVSPKAVILNDVEELRFISYTLAGTPLLLVLNSAPDWTPEKSRKTVAVARTLNINISLVWLDESPVPSQLATTITEANGKLVRLNELTRAVMDRFCLGS